MKCPNRIKCLQIFCKSLPILLKFFTQLFEIQALRFKLIFLFKHFHLRSLELSWRIFVKLSYFIPSLHVLRKGIFITKLKSNHQMRIRIFKLLESTILYQIAKHTFNSEDLREMALPFRLLVLYITHISQLFVA